MNQFKSVQQRREQALTAYCTNIYTVKLSQGLVSNLHGGCTHHEIRKVIVTKYPIDKSTIHLRIDTVKWKLRIA